MNHIFMALKFKFTYLGRIEIRNKVLYYDNIRNFIRQPFAQRDSYRLIFKLNNVFTKVFVVTRLISNYTGAHNY